jgi:hypothetical protein
MSRLNSKITTKTIIGNVAEHLPTDNETKPLYRIIGLVNGVFTKTTQYGESIGFKGQFKAESLLTGEISYAGTAWLPQVLTDAIGGMWQGEPLQFAADVSVKKADNAIGYEYVVNMLGNQKHDVFDAIESNLQLKLEFNGKAA